MWPCGPAGARAGGVVVGGLEAGDGVQSAVGVGVQFGGAAAGFQELADVA
jgi:hypothetical protein